MRVALGLAMGLKVMPVVLVVVAVLLALAKVRPSPLNDRVLVAGGLLGCVLALGLVLRSAFRRLSPLAGAIALDRHHGLRGRVAGALSFAAVDSEARTAFMRLAIEDGARHAKELEPRRAVPIPVPRELLLVTLLVFGVAGVAVLEVPVVRHLPPPPAPKPLLMGADDLELFRDLGADLAKQSQNPEQQAAIGRYNRLVEDIAEHRVDRHEVFRRLAEIERDLAHGLDEQDEALDEGLEAVARELGRSELTRKASEAMSEKRLDDAEKALRELADKLRKSAPKPSAGELDRLRKALSRAAEQSRERVQAIEARRRELQAERESLLKKKKEAGDAGAADTDKKIEENRRKLERLDRERSRAERTSGQMSELDKELAKAAEDLRKELGDAAKDLEQGAEKLNRMAREKLDDAQKRGREELLRDLLPVFDNLERAVLHAGQASDAKAVADGVTMVLKQFADTLGRIGIKRVPTVGSPFDPSQHEAIQQLETDEHPAGTIVAEVQPGYAMGDRLVRAAMVVVAKPSQKNGEGDKTEPN